jgi:hypothetical protein
MCIHEYAYVCSSICVYVYVRWYIYGYLYVYAHEHLHDRTRIARLVRAQVYTNTHT